MRKLYILFTTALKNNSNSFKPFIAVLVFLVGMVPGRTWALDPTTFTLGNPTTAVNAANICAGSSKVLIHAFTITADGNSGFGTLKNFSFTTTGNYTPTEIVNLKIWYNTTNDLANAILVATTTPVVAGLQTFQAFTRKITGGATVFFWITMDVPTTVTDGHIIAVSASASTDMTTTLTKSGSANASGTQTLKAQPSAAGTITGPATVCQGKSGIVYSVGTIANATSYIWAYSGAGATINGTGANITIDFSTSATSGNLTVKGNNNSCGDGAVSANYAITISPLPVAAGPITGPATVCQGKSGIVYSVGTIANATSYIWAYSGAGATINGTGANITIDFSTSATSGNLTVKGNNSCGDGAVSANYAITISPLPVAAGPITGPATVCQGKSGIVYSVGTIANATSYIWAYSGAGATINGTGANITIDFSTSATSGNLTVKGNNSCGDGAVSANYAITISPLPVAAGPITGPATVCQGKSGIVYSVGTIANATSYIWAYSGAGATINGTGANITIDFSTSATSGNLTVKGNNNSCGDGAVSANYAITISPLPVAAGPITGPATVCQGKSGIVYSVGTIANATSYIWAYSGAGATINGTGANITIDFSTSATSGNLTVKGNNSCGDGAVSANYAITISPLPVAAGPITGPATVCQGKSGIVYSVGTIANATSYIWAYSGAGATINGTGANITIDFSTSATSGNLTVKGNNSCGDGAVSANYAITISPLPVAAGPITGPATVCQGKSGIVYSVGTIANATSYIWAYSGAGATINGTGANITIDFSTSATSGNLTVKGNNSCGDGTSANFAVTVNSLPFDKILAVESDTICSGSSTNIQISNSQIGVNYQLRRNSNNSLVGGPVAGTGGIINLPTGILTAVQATVVFNVLAISATSPTFCSIQLSSTVSVIVNALPDDKSPTAVPDAICSGSSSNVQIPNSQVGVNYQLRRDSNNSAVGGPVAGTGGMINLPTDNLTNTTTGPTTAIFNVLATSATAPTFCSLLLSATATITVRPIPSVTISGNKTVCQNTTLNPTQSQPVTFTNMVSLPVIVTYNINGGADSSKNVAGNGTAIISQPANAADTFRYNLDSVKYQTVPYCPNSTTSTATIIVKPVPAPPSISPSLLGTKICQNTKNQNFSASTVTPPVNFGWFMLNQNAEQGIVVTSGNNHANAIISFGTANATIRLTDTAANGCVNFIYDTIKISPTSQDNPVVIHNGTDFVCLNNTVKSYEWGWDDNNFKEQHYPIGNDIPGGQAPFVTAQNLYRPGGDTTTRFVWVKTTDSAGCFTKNYMEKNRPYVRRGGSEIPPEESQLEPIKIYPNPATGNVVVSWHYSSAADDAVVTVVDMTGKKLLVKYLKGGSAVPGKVSIDVASLPRGVYAVNVLIKSRTMITGKLLKE